MSMTRPLRIEFPSALYHVASRGNNKQDIYRNDGDRELFLQVLKKTIERYGWLCHAYCLLTNHYHLLIETPKANLAIGMRQVNGVYSRRSNKIHGSCGHVFQGRYFSKLIEKDEHFLAALRYIALNPVEAGLSKEPGSWKWSSIYEIFNRKRFDSFVDSSFTLSFFSSDIAKATALFRNFLISEDSRCDPYEMDGGIAFGGKKFREDLETIRPDCVNNVDHPRDQLFISRLSLEDVFSGVTDKKTRNDRIYEANSDHGYTMREIARFLGLHYSTVSHVLKKY